MNNQDTLFNLEDIPVVEVASAEQVISPVKLANPCVALYGSGPEGVACKNCVHLRYSLGYAKRFYKCDLRALTHGKGSDHAVGWPSCGRYEQRTEPYYGG